MHLVAKSKPRPDLFPKPGGLAEPSPDLWPGSPPKGTSALGHGHKMRRSKFNRITSLGETYRVAQRVRVDGVGSLLKCKTDKASVSAQRATVHTSS